MCDVCNIGFFQIMKIPCGYYIEQNDEDFTFQLTFRNICFECISSKKEFEE